MRHGFTTMNEIRDGMEHMLDAKTMMHLTGYKGWVYNVRVAQELIDEMDNAYWDMCKETILWAFSYACGGEWEFDVAALNLLIDAWLNTNEEE
jgi:hypothetical protein